MKNLVFILLVGICVSCAQSDYVVQSSEAFDTDLSQYETFNFSPQALNTDARFILNDLALKNEIRETIEHEMMAEGLEKSASNADLLINFRVFDEPTEFQAFVDENNNWTDRNVNGAEDVRTYQLEAGTLIVSAVDTETGELVWTGFASGIMDGNQFDRDEQSISKAVSMIYDQFDNDGDRTSQL